MKTASFFSLLLFLLLTLRAQAERGDIVYFDSFETQDAESLSTQLQEEINNLSGFSISEEALGVFYDVELYQVAYETVGIDGVTPITATGIVVIPTSYVCPAPMTTYGHGLTLKHSGIPSSEGSFYRYLCKGIAGNGYIVAAPDYIHMGYDATPGVQAFMHADSEASATIDLIRATRNYCNQNGIEYGEDLFISGYSQGGHSSMATCREIQQNYSDEFTVTAAMPGGGTYDMSGIAADSLASPTRTTGEPHALCLIVKSYLNAYADSLELFDYNYTMDELFQSPYDSLINEILDPYHPNGNTGLLLNIPNMMLEENFRLDFMNNPDDHPIRTLLSYNNLYDWAPQMKMRIYHSTADVENPFPNVTFAYDHYIANGATDLELVTIDGFSHSLTGLLHVLASKNWFNELRTPCIPAAVTNQQLLAAEVHVYPNPFTQSLSVELLQQYGVKEIQLFHHTGKLVQEWTVDAVANTSANVLQLPIIDDLAAGVYMLKLVGEEGSLVKGVVRY